ncbi:hypothetical protein GIB67_037690 [Kingdonia uniflora]|uniref:Uncharacterized protein n=1 Tax=Kingdonia uniflora TaxID=39325 RepID=A0A7J7MGH6_9MAGN|nr:hypothetical protein GIB67_037690 [Kingdonia uniflora]
MRLYEEAMVNSEAKKYKTAPLQHRDLLEKLFDGQYAIGDFAWSPGIASVPFVVVYFPDLKKRSQQTLVEDIPPFEKLSRLQLQVLDLLKVAIVFGQKELLEIHEVLPLPLK